MSRSKRRRAVSPPLTQYTPPHGARPVVIDSLPRLLTGACAPDGNLHGYYFRVADRPDGSCYWHLFRGAARVNGGLSDSRDDAADAARHAAVNDSYLRLGEDRA